MLKEIPYVNTEVSFTSRDHEDKIIDHIIKNLPADSRRYYIENEEDTNNFKILEDPQQKDKDRFFELIFDTEKNLDRLNNIAEIAELKRIRNQFVKILNNLGQTYVKL